jgi:hypothetical protein
VRGNLTVGDRSYVDNYSGTTFAVTGAPSGACRPVPGIGR